MTNTNATRRMDSKAGRGQTAASQTEEMTSPFVR